MNDIIDVKVKEILDTKTEEFLSLKKDEFLGFAKKTVEAYLETGRILCEVNEKLAKVGRGNNRWATWLEEVSMPKRTANEVISVYRKYGNRAVTAQFSPTVLVALSSPSADPELVSEVESRIQSGEKLTVSEVKNILKKVPQEVLLDISNEALELHKDIPFDGDREARKSQEAESDYIFTEEYQEDRKKAKESLRVEAKKLADESLDFQIKSEQIIAAHIRELYSILEANGIEYPKLDKNQIEYTMWNDIYPDDQKDSPEWIIK